MFIAVPNALGALLGAIQFVLCFLFPRKVVAGSAAAGKKKDADIATEEEEDAEAAEGRRATAESDPSS